MCNQDWVRSRRAKTCFFMTWFCSYCSACASNVCVQDRAEPEQGEESWSDCDQLLYKTQFNLNHSWVNIMFHHVSSCFITFHHVSSCFIVFDHYVRNKRSGWQQEIFVPLRSHQSRDRSRVACQLVRFLHEECFQLWCGNRHWRNAKGNPGEFAFSSLTLL